jgi:hypothetical protein
MYFYEVPTSHLAGEILITKPCDGGAQPVPVVVEFYNGIIFTGPAGPRAYQKFGIQDEIFPKFCLFCTSKGNLAPMSRILHSALGAVVEVTECPEVD